MGQWPCDWRKGDWTPVYKKEDKNAKENYRPAKNYFTSVNEIHAYNTRLASRQSYSLPKTRTNFGIFNIRYQGPKIWNSLDESDEKLLDFQLKKKLKIRFIDSY